MFDRTRQKLSAIPAHLETTGITLRHLGAAIVAMLAGILVILAGILLHTYHPAQP